MRIQKNYNLFNMKEDTPSDRLWISFDREEVSTKLSFIGAHQWKPQQIMIPHVHKEYEFVYILQGKGYILSNCMGYTLSQNDIIVSAPNVEHLMVCDPAEPFKLLFLGYDFLEGNSGGDPAVFGLDRIFLKYFESYQRQYRSPVITDIYGVRKSLVIMSQEIKLQPFLMEIRIRANLAEFFLAMIRNLSSRLCTEDLNLNENMYVTKAKTFIENNINNHPCLELIAAHVCLSPSHFSRLFKCQVGLSPIEYVNTVKIEKAKHLLIYSDIPLTDISDRLGFNTLHYFSYFFKKNTGICPTTYRQNYRRKISIDCKKNTM